MDAVTSAKTLGSRYRTAVYRAQHREQARAYRARHRAARLIRAKHRAWEQFQIAVATGTDAQIRLAWARYCDYAARLVAATPPEQVTG